MTGTATVAETGAEPGAVAGEVVGGAGGGVARWRVLYPALARLEPGGLLSYEEMGELLGLDFLDRRQKQLIHAAARQAAERLRTGERKVFRIMRGHGYQRAEPQHVLAMAHRHQARAVAEIEAGHSKVDAIDLGRLDATTAKLFRLTAMGFARQAAMMHNLDVRASRLESVLADVQGTAQQAQGTAQQAIDRAEATDAELTELRQRLRRLEAQQGIPPTATAPATEPIVQPAVQPAGEPVGVSSGAPAAAPPRIPSAISSGSSSAWPPNPYSGPAAQPPALVPAAVPLLNFQRPNPQTGSPIPGVDRES